MSVFRDRFAGRSADSTCARPRKWIGPGSRTGALISLAEADFDVIFTVDRAFTSPSKEAGRLGIVILEAVTTDPILLLPHMPAVIAALRRVGRGEVLRVTV